MPIDYTDFLSDAYAIFGCDAFGDDNDGYRVWDNSDSALDLTKGDGVDTDTMPTLTSVPEHGTYYYVFDGADDYLSGWPTLTGDYTVSAAFTTSYPDAVPYVTQCNDSTVEDLLTVAGAFAGNLHSIVIFDRLLDPLELYYLEWLQLRRLWRETYVDAFLHRLIREGSCVLANYFEDIALRYEDYADLDIAATPTDVTWASGLTFPNAGSVLEYDADAGLNLDELTIFIESPGFDSAASNDTVLQNGTNYDLEINSTGGNVVFTLNGVTMTTAQNGYSSFAISAVSGDKPRLYCDGYYKAEGASNVTLSTGGASQLRLGNESPPSTNYQSTIRKFMLFNERLADAEISALHIASQQSRSYPTEGFLLGFEGTDTNGVSIGYVAAHGFTAVQSGASTRIRVYSQNSGNIKYALYSESGGTPDTLLASNDAGVAVTGGQWNDLPLLGVPIVSGTTYFISAILDTVGAMRRSTDPGDFYYKSATYAGYSFPASWGTPGSYVAFAAVAAVYGAI